MVFEVFKSMKKTVTLSKGLSCILGQVLKWWDIFNFRTDGIFNFRNDGIDYWRLILNLHDVRSHF